MILFFYEIDARLSLTECVPFEKNIVFVMDWCKTNSSHNH